jgi:hypothetical protein
LIIYHTYKGCAIDATPDFSLGKFFARARMTRASADADADAEIHTARDLAWFDSEDEAIQFGYQWAMA